MKRALLALCFVCAALPAAADRLILIPTGRKLLSSTVRLDFLAVPSRDRTQGWIGTGLGEMFELEVSGERLDSNRVLTSLNFAYNYMVPLTDLAPGISFGVQDALNVTEDGRGIYVAVTFRYGNYGEHNQDVPTELTIGLWNKAKGVAFGGARLPFSKHLMLVAEHDTMRLTAGFEISPVEGSSFRFLFRQDQVILGLQIQARF